MSGHTDLESKSESLDLSDQWLTLSAPLCLSPHCCCYAAFLWYISADICCLPQLFFRSVVVKCWADVFFSFHVSVFSLFLVNGMLCKRAEETHTGKEAQLERKVIFFMPKLANFFGSAFTDNGPSDIHVAPIAFS